MSSPVATKSPIILWFRFDLRLADHPALHQAVQTGRTVIPVFIWDPKDKGAFALGGASRWWLHHSLAALAKQLHRAGGRLIRRIGDPERILMTLCRDTGADTVYWSRRYEPDVAAKDRKLTAALHRAHIEANSFDGTLLFEPESIRTKSGTPYRKFTPFAHACEQQPEPGKPLPAPTRWPAPADWPKSVDLEEFGLLPKINWAKEFSPRWQPGEVGAKAELSRFMDSWLGAYQESRNRPAEKGTSSLSPHLRFGEISPRFIWRSVQQNAAQGCARGLFSGAEVFMKELLWREFSYHLLHHFPETVHRPLDVKFNHMRWRKSPKDLRRWQQGQTGFPIVDAGLRQLWRTGWMHNRVRMIVGSFLIKDLHISWQEGFKWFWDTLVDADPGNNTMNWQWVAGCGADAAPFFRIFNPVLQGEKFDSEGAYVRQWVPELERMPARWIHRPFEAPKDVLADAGVDLGDTYPAPIVDHGQERIAALQAFRHLRAKKKT